MSTLIARQLKGYKDADPAVKQAKALPLIVFKSVAGDSSTHKLLALSQLVIGAFFFAMRSCEYLKTGRVGKTKKLTVGNIKFYKGRRLLDYEGDLEHASFVSITFVFQKNREKMQTISQRRTGLRLCPVRCWAQLVERVLSYPSATLSSPVNVVMVAGRLREVSDSDVITRLRSAVAAIGEQILA